MIIGGIFGPKLSGKSTLAKSLAKAYWKLETRRTLVFDPNGENWGPQAWVTANEDVFWPAIWKTTGCLLIVEEAASTISRERELIPVFTRIRHQGHKVIIVGHSGGDLLPVMRQQIDTLFLFRQPPEAADIWRRLFSQEEIMRACKLGRYEFLHAEIFSPVKINKLQIGVDS